MLVAACSSSAPGRTAASHTPATYPAVGDQTASDWIALLHWVDSKRGIVAARTFHGTGAAAHFALGDATTVPLLLHVIVPGAGRFIVDEIDAHGAANLDVSRIGPYDGIVVSNVDRNAVALSMRANGPWTIVVSDLRSAPTFTAKFSGSGDAVGLYRGSFPFLASTFRGNSDFTATYYGLDGTEDLTGDEFGNYHGVAPVGHGTAVVFVQSGGTWTISGQRQP